MFGTSTIALIDPGSLLGINEKYNILMYFHPKDPFFI